MKRGKKTELIITLSLLSVNGPIINAVYQCHQIKHCTTHVKHSVITAKLLCLDSTSTGSMLNVIFRPTLSIIFDHIVARSTLKVVHYFTSAEKKCIIFTHSCPPYYCMYYFYFASYTAYSINLQSVLKHDKLYTAHHRYTYTTDRVYMARSLCESRDFYDSTDFIVVHMISLSADNKFMPLLSSSK